jgi:hypothetical protein
MFLRKVDNTCHSTYAVLTYKTTIILDAARRLTRRDSVVGMATGYGLHDRGVGVRVPVGL